MMIKSKIIMASVALSLLTVGCSSTSASNSSNASSSGSTGNKSTANNQSIASGKKITVALINGNNIDPFFLTIWHGAVAEAAKQGVNLVEVAPSAYDYSQQVPLINDEIAKKVDAIILSPDSDTALDSTMAKAKAAGIPVICVNARQELLNNTQNSMAFLGSDNLQMSKTGGDLLAKLLNNQGTIAVVNSVAGSKGDYLRAIGVYDEVKAKYPNMKVLPMQYSDDSQTKAQAITTSLIESHPDLAGIFAVDSFTGQGVATGVLAANKQGKVKVVAIDAEPQEVSFLKQGVIQGLIAQQPYQMGVQAVDDVVFALKNQKDKIQRSVVLPASPVTTDNLNDPATQNLIYQMFHQ